MNGNRKQRAPQSALYKLKAGVAAKLERMVDSTKPLGEIRAWLRREHGVKTSETALSRWSQTRFKARLQPLSSPRRRRRDAGRVSPLDRLPAATQTKLLKRCEAGTPGKKILAWLRDKHACVSSGTALSEWFGRQKGTAGQGPVACVAGNRVELTFTGVRGRPLRLELRAIDAPSPIRKPR